MCLVQYVYIHKIDVITHNEGFTMTIQVVSQMKFQSSYKNYKINRIEADIQIKKHMCVRARVHFECV